MIMNISLKMHPNPALSVSIALSPLCRPIRPAKKAIIKIQNTFFILLLNK